MAASTAEEIKTPLAATDSTASPVPSAQTPPPALTDEQLQQLLGLYGLFTFFANAVPRVAPRKYIVLDRKLCFTLRGYDYHGRDTYSKTWYTDGGVIYTSPTSSISISFGEFEEGLTGGGWKVNGDSPCKVREWLDGRVTQLDEVKLKLGPEPDPIALAEWEQLTKKLDIPVYKQTHYSGGN